jgi:hypothetical protein
MRGMIKGVNPIFAHFRVCVDCCAVMISCKSLICINGFVLWEVNFYCVIHPRSNIYQIPQVLLLFIGQRESDNPAQEQLIQRCASL